MYTDIGTDNKQHDEWAMNGYSMSESRSDPQFVLISTGKLCLTSGWSAEPIFKQT